MTRNSGLSRRQALARLGLGLGLAYCAPAVSMRSAARASSAPSAASQPSQAASPPSAPSPPAPSSPTSPSPSGPASGAAESGAAEEFGNPQFGCSVPSNPGQRITASRNDMRLAQAAVSRGEAKPLRDIVGIVQSEHKGRILRVGFKRNGSKPFYWLQMVNRQGSLQTVTVNAATGKITGVSGC